MRGSVVSGRRPQNKASVVNAMRDQKSELLSNLLLGIGVALYLVVKAAAVHPVR